jgi:hypothetical protein
MKSFTIEIDTEGGVKTNLKGYEGESPKLAAIVEAAAGQVARVEWNPKAHAHQHSGRTVQHSH